MLTLSLGYNHSIANSLACALSYYDVKEVKNPIKSYQDNNGYDTIAEAKEVYYQSKKYYNKYTSLGFTVENMKELFSYT